MGFQLLGATVHLGGDRDTTVVRGLDNPVTFPEVLVLRAIHGGEANVHSLMEVGEVDRDHAAERQRLRERYGAQLVGQVFPGSLAHLPERDETVISMKDEMDAQKAADEKRAAARARRDEDPAGQDATLDQAEPPKAETENEVENENDPNAVPDLTAGGSTGSTGSTNTKAKSGK